MMIVNLRRAGGTICADAILLANFPNKELVIIAPGRQPLPVGREGYRIDSVRMPFECEPPLAASGFSCSSAASVISRVLTFCSIIAHHAVAEHVFYVEHLDQNHRRRCERRSKHDANEAERQA
jgi:hypothetical protein